MPRIDRRSSSSSSPASRFDSPSRSRSRVFTRRARNDGSAWSPIVESGPSELLSTRRSRMISFSNVTRGVISTITPTVR